MRPPRSITSLKLKARVCWHRTPGADQGMGMEFLFDDASQAEIIRKLVIRLAERAALETALAELDQRFRMDLPPLRKGYEDEPGYDEVLSRTHNPFVLKDAAQKAGWADVVVLFYHYHAIPPMLERLVPGLFLRESLAIEDPTDWRGHFMASAFIVTGRKP